MATRRAHGNARPEPSRASSSSGAAEHTGGPRGSVNDVGHSDTCHVTDKGGQPQGTEQLRDGRKDKCPFREAVDSFRRNGTPHREREGVPTGTADTHMCPDPFEGTDFNSFNRQLGPRPNWQAFGHGARTPASSVIRVYWPGKGAAEHTVQQ